MQKEKPHPLLLILFLLGISAVISGWETLALQHPTTPAQTNRFEAKRELGKPAPKVQTLSILTAGSSANR